MEEKEGGTMDWSLGSLVSCRCRLEGFPLILHLGRREEKQKRGIFFVLFHFHTPLAHTWREGGEVVVGGTLSLRGYLARGLG